MDASNEFRFIGGVPNQGTCNSNGIGKSNGKRNSAGDMEGEGNLRNVPVCVCNTNKNVKLRFVWDKAFKLFQSHRTVYKAQSGVNFQDYGNGSGGGSKWTLTSTTSRKSGSGNLTNGTNRESNSNENEDDGEKRMKSVEEVSVIVPRKRASCGRGKSCAQRPVSISGGEKPEGDDEREDDEGEGRGVRSRCALANCTCSKSSKTNCKCTGNFHLPNHSNSSAHLRRSQSTKSHFSQDANFHCFDDIQAEDSSTVPPQHFFAASLQYPHHSQRHMLKHFRYPYLGRNLKKLSSGDSAEGNRERDPSPHPQANSRKLFFGLLKQQKVEESPNGFCDCDADSLESPSPDFESLGLDSGLDTWKSPGSRSNNSSCRTPPPGIRHSSIVCTISQRIPEFDGKGSTNQIKCETEGRKDEIIQEEVSNGRVDGCSSNSAGGYGNTTVVLISAEKDTESQSAVECEDAGVHFSDYDVECMSEIDLNSESESQELDEEEQRVPTKETQQANKMKFLLHRHTHNQSPFPDNELDSLDLTLFEQSRDRHSNPRFSPSNSNSDEDGGFLEAMQHMSLVEMEEHFYDTVSSEGQDSLNTPPSTGALPFTHKREYWNWSDAASEFEFMTPASVLNRDIPMGHSPRGYPPDVDWDPHFCVLNQLDQTFTAYRSEEMSIFPGTPTRPRTQNVFSENGISPTEVPRVRLDGGPNSIKCLINNSKWGMNPLMEEEEETSTMPHGNSTDKERKTQSADYSSSGSNQRNSSGSPLDTSYDKACGSERRGSAPLTPLLGRETPSRFANFFSKRSFKSNPLKRTKSVTKLERKKGAGMEPESSILYPSRLRTSRSHESLLAWNNHSLNNFVNNGMMSTMDLAAGDVSIRPLHPSMLSQEFAFQVTTPSGSKFYSCSSAAERDAWVHSLRQAIKPHTDEIRRQENSLKIWILEAKGVGNGKNSSKRYFCELYLDGALYARTCGKPKGEMLFWGEHFEFTQLPNCVQLITVIFFREGDKKRKKERNTCIGKVKIPVNCVNSRYLIEKWYPVQPDSNQQNSNKDKDGPSLRIKCKFQSVDILPLRCYKPFLQYVKDEYGPVSECLESILSVKAKEDLASAMVHVLHHETIAKEFIAELALQEILKSGDEKLTFRGNSIATKSMESFLKLTGTEYLHATLGPFIEQFQGSEDVYDCEIDPMKLTQGSNLSKNQQNLRVAIDTVWKAILHSHSVFPMELRDCFSHCREALKSAGKEELSDHLISASIFLRFLCPAILSPSLFNITNEYPTEKSARNLTLVAKVLQTLANFTRFQGKENYMEFINDFVEREADNMKAFLASISSPLSAEAVKKTQKENRDKVPAGGFIDLGKYLSILSTLLSESVAKIAPKNDRFKQLQDILETIHMWLKQPANATNVSMFSFPHLTSPPPTVPPPPAPLGIPMNHRISNPNNPQAVNHQYQVPISTAHMNMNNAGTPIYAVSSVIHNQCNPNVKNISQVHMNMNMNNPAGVALQLQIPSGHGHGQMLLNNTRSGSQASSGYQSQSPVLEGEDKSKKAQAIEQSLHHHSVNHNAHGQKERQENGNGTPHKCPNPAFNRKAGSQSVDDLSSLGMDANEENVFKKRLTRSSSSSDCEYAPSTVSSGKAKSRSSQHKMFAHYALAGGQQSAGGKPLGKSHQHHRLSRRSSAELLRRNHPYSSSTDEDSDSGHININERDENVPQLPPRRSHAKRNSGHRPNPDGSNGEKTLEEYEKEMLELRRAMEALQMKLNRAEERLFGHESPGQQSKRESDASLGVGTSANSPGNGNSNCSGNKERLSRNSASEENAKEMDQLLQRLLSAEEEMKREQELLTALDKKQKLIDAQEQKIARLDSVNNQLLSALAQIRDSLQQQHVQQQQQKIQQQLLKQQQHLHNLANGIAPINAHSNHRSIHNHSATNYLNNNNANVDRLSRPHQLQYSQQMQSVNRNSPNNNTTKVLITSDSSGSESPTSNSLGNNRDHTDQESESNRNSCESSYLGEQALKMLAELKSSSC